MANRPAPENVFLANALFRALRVNDPRAFIQGNLEDVAIDGHFDLMSVSDQVLESARASSHNFFSAGRKEE